MVIYMSFPKIYDQYIKQKDFHRDKFGKSNAGVYLFDDMVLKVQPISIEAENELEMLKWLNGKINVPDIIEHTIENECSYILMSKCEGEMSCAEPYMTNPVKQVELLADALHQLWSIPIADCPCCWSLDKRLRYAEENVVCGNVDVADAQPDTFGSDGFKDPEELLNWLIVHKPEETPVISHGDFCLPNIFVNDNGLTGLIDLGKTGTADRWQDIALCYRSLSNNYSGTYDEMKYAGFKDEMLFGALGIKPDWDRIRYYILLDELF